MSVTEQAVRGRSSWPACTGPVLVALGEDDELASVIEAAAVAADRRSTRLSVIGIALPAPVGMTVSVQAMPVNVDSVRAANVDRLCDRVARFRAEVPAGIGLDHRVEAGAPSRILTRAVARLVPSAIVLASLADHRGVARVITRARHAGTDVHVVARRAPGGA